MQVNISRLSPQEWFSIGGRSWVRKLNGESSLIGEPGWTLRNEVSTAFWDSGQGIYGGIEAGEMGSTNAQLGLGNTLAGEY